MDFYYCRRGPNKYTRKWDDEDAYARQMSNKSVRQPRQRLPPRQEEYEADFPAIHERRRGGGVRSHERREPDSVPRRSPPRRSPRRSPPRRSPRNSPRRSPKRSLNHELSDNDVRYRDDYRNQGQRRIQPVERSRSFTKRIPVSNDRPPIQDRGDVHEVGLVSRRFEVHEISVLSLFQ